MQQTLALTDRVSCDYIENSMKDCNQPARIIDCLSQKFDIVGDHRRSLALNSRFLQFIILRLWEYDDKDQGRQLRYIQYVLKQEGFLDTNTMQQLGKDLRLRLDWIKALDVLHC